MWYEKQDGDPLFRIRDGKGARNESLSDRRCISSLDEIQLRCCEGSSVDAEGADDRVDVVFFQE